MLRGHVFEKQLFSNNCFALFIDTFLGQQCGVINGCVPTKESNNSISLTSGYFCIQGRFLQEDGGTTFDIDSPEENDLYCKLICEIDLSKRNTASILNQAYYKIVTDENDYPELTKGLITEEGTIYQYEFCRFKNTSAGITDFSDTREFLDFDSIYTEVRNTLNLIKTNAERDINSITSDLEEGFNEWFVTIQDILDEDTAGHLYNLINTKQNKILQKYITIPLNWSETAPYEQEITVEGVSKANNIVNLYPVYSDYKEIRATEKEEYNKLSVVDPLEEDGIKIICDEEAPTMELYCRLEVLTK